MPVESDLGRAQKEDAIRRHTAVLGNPDISAKMRFDTGNARRTLERDARPVPQGEIRQ